MLSAFDRRQLEAVSRLLGNVDFQHFMAYIDAESINLALASVRATGEDCEKLKGGSIILEQLANTIKASRSAIQSEHERQEMSRLDRDPVSP